MQSKTCLVLDGIQVADALFLEAHTEELLDHNLLLELLVHVAMVWHATFILRLFQVHYETILVLVNLNKIRINYQPAGTLSQHGL